MYPPVNRGYRYPRTTVPGGTLILGYMYPPPLKCTGGANLICDVSSTVTVTVFLSSVGGGFRSFESAYPMCLRKCFTLVFEVITFLLCWCNRLKELSLKALEVLCAGNAQT